MPQIAVNKQLLKIFGLLSLACFIFYANIIRNLYSEDDYRVTSDFFRRNAMVEKGFGGLKEIFTTRYTDIKMNDLEISYGYRPIARATFAIEWELFGQNPHAGHFINILLYCITTCMLFYLLSKTVFRNKDTLYPLLTTLLFIAHPIHTEVVASLKNREEQLSFLFGILFIAAIWRYFNTRQLYLPWLAALLLGISILSKESGIIYLAAAPVFIYFFHPQAARTLLMREKINYITILALSGVAYAVFRKIDPTLIFIALFAVLVWVNKRRYSALVSYCFVGLLIMFNAILLPNTMLGEVSKAQYFWANPLYGEMDFLHRAGFFFNAFLYNIKLLFYPHPLGFYYGYNVVPATGLFSPSSLLGLAIMGGLLYIAYTQRNKNKIVAFTIVFFFCTWAPFSNLLPVPGIIADRLLYVPSLAFCIGLALVLINLKQWLGFKNFTPVYVVAGIIGVVYFAKVFTRNKDWYSYYTLYSKGAKDFPNSAKANSMFATLLIDSIYKEKDQRKHGEMIRTAVKHYEQSLKAFPTYAESLNALGFIYYQSGQYQRALSYHLKNIQANPDFEPAYINTASTYIMLKDTATAKYYFTLALQKDSLSADVYINFADIYIKQNKPDSAAYLYKLAKKRGIDDKEIQTSLKKLAE